MSDQGLISSSLQSLLSIVKNSENAGIPIALIKTPQSLLPSLEKPTTIAGKIIDYQQNQQITIKTDKGAIIAKSQGQAAIKIGDQVQITLIHPKGRKEIQAFLQKTHNTTDTQRPNATTTNLSTNTNSKPALHQPEQLITTPRIDVKATTAQELKTLTRPDIDKIDTKLPISSKISIQLNNQVQSPIKVEIKSHHNNEANILKDTAAKSEQNTTKQSTIENSVQIKSHNLTNTSAKKVSTNTISIKTINEPLNSKPSSINIGTVTKQNVQIAEKGGNKSNTPDIIQSHKVRAGQTTGHLVGFTKNQNFPVIRLPPNTPNASTQHITIQRQIENFPLGSRVTLQIVGTSPNMPDTSQVITASSQSKHAMAFLSPSTNWPTLTDIEQALHQVNPAVAQSFANNIPTPAQPHQMNATSLFFLSAVRSGDVQSWIGDKASDLLRTLGKSELISNLSGELGSINLLNSETSAQEWRSLSMPLSWQDEISQIVLHYRKQNQGGDSDTTQDGEQTRFVMDIKLSNIGDLQIDGLFAKKDDKPQRLDLILRSEHSFSEAMRVQMQNIYQSALNREGFDGELGFQRRENWVQVTQDLKPEYTENI